ncbi:hypothetical protein AYO49_02775 [Verrucomicrobiaceae bacterium SCGC AG-212-N21]|nr:hypothetical protein AYO49_02775 [Verrucomicrobiaceae bacterium SCGC AG-212-N21]
MKTVARLFMIIAMVSLMASCASNTATTKHSDAIADGKAKQKSRATGVAHTGFSVGGFAGARGD